MTLGTLLVALGLATAPPMPDSLVSADSAMSLLKHGGYTVMWRHGQTDRSVSSLPLLMAALDDVREHGYATNYEESEEGVGSVAIAVRDATGRALGAIAVAVPTTRLNQEARRAIAEELISLSTEHRL